MPNKNMRKMYSDEQIESLVNQKVQQMISDGDISLGTKLYLHHVTLDNGLDDDYFTFISTDSTPLLKTDDVPQILIKMDKYTTLKRFNFENFGGSGRLLSYVTKSPTVICFIGLDNDNEVISGDSAGNLVAFPNANLLDEVTPL